MKDKKIVVGDEFTARPNVKIKVVEYHSCDYIVVEDEAGNRRDVTANNLRRSTLTWLNLDGSLRGVKGTAKKVKKGYWDKSKRLREEFSVGAVVNSNYDGTVEVVEVKSSREVVVRWKSTGQLDTVNAAMLRCGGFRNPERNTGPDGYYVYQVSNMVTGEVVYVGQGKGERMRHALSGLPTTGN